jgi:hypothetical protein
MAHPSGHQSKDRFRTVLKRLPAKHVNQFPLHTLNLLDWRPLRRCRLRLRSESRNTTENNFDAASSDPTSEALTPLTLYGYKKASTELEEAPVNGMAVEALSKENRGRPSLNSVAF